MARWVYRFGEGSADGGGADRNLLGGKGAGLAEMTRLGIPVPPGFTITTEVGASWDAARGMPPEVRAEVDAAVAWLEATSGRRFGDPERPLLVSVRSGARASMPGMMDTILNLGANAVTAEALAKETGDRRFAFDAWRRLLVMYGDVVLRMSRTRLDAEVDRARIATAQRRGIDATRLGADELRRRVPDSDLDPDELAKACDALQALIATELGHPFPTDPREHLLAAVAAVFSSWDNPRARTYRRLNKVPASWGTACTVQAMVFGNLGADSATGVCFTRDPSTGEKRFYGEWLPQAQGEDVVAGLRTPLPLGKDEPGRAAESLEVRMPAMHADLVRVKDSLEVSMRDMLDIEFTIERGKLWILQCRAGKRTVPAAIRIAVDLANEQRITRDEALVRVDADSVEKLLAEILDPAAPKHFLARGLPASPGGATGEVVFDPDEAERRAGQGKAVILVRDETSPEDIHGMHAARAIVTARGGMTSHAAVVARGMGKPCVAGCSALAVDVEAGTLTVTVHDEQGRPKERVVIRAGEHISVDGATGSLYLGTVPMVPAPLPREFDELMTWADEALARPGARHLAVRANADTPRDAQAARKRLASGVGLCRTEHMFFNDDRIDAVRQMILAASADDRAVALAKLLPMQRSDFEEILRENAGFPVVIRLLDPPLHEFVPREPKQFEHLSVVTGKTVRELVEASEALHESNPMLGHRGSRLAVTHPDIYAMQARAIFEAACKLAAEGVDVHPEVMVPFVISREEVVRMREIVEAAAAEVFAAAGRTVHWSFGTMIEIPRAALLAGSIADVVDFFSFGTNDLTQMTLGLSRDDAGRFLGTYVEQGLLAADPFRSVDVAGVGALVRRACEEGRAANPKLGLGVCGEHGGDPASIRFFHEAGLDYVSCSPFRVPIARLAAAQASVGKR